MFGRKDAEVWKHVDVAFKFCAPVAKVENFKALLLKAKSDHLLRASGLNRFKSHTILQIKHLKQCYAVWNILFCLLTIS